ncbi:MAG: hypothetical protein ACREFO_00675 [Acetobacteraceae bacterium]
MSETTTIPLTALTAERLFDERHSFWGGFYRFVWGIAALAVLLLIGMAIFLT